MNKKINIPQLKIKANEFRKDILKMIHSAGSGHPGGSLSLVEILISLYEYQLKHKPDNPKWPERDRLIISKGHATPAVYVALANYGYFPKKELETFRRLGARLQGHVYVNVPGVELNTGSLGHGLAVCNGFALGARLLKKDQHSYCIMGDGELQEGSVWEAAMTAAHYKLDRVCAIIDYNKVQENGPVKDIMNLEPLAEKWRAFGWEAKEIDGHDFGQIFEAFSRVEKVKNKPYVIIAHTVKGKGVSFMEGDRNWHGKAPNDEQFKTALAELEKNK